MTCYPSHFRFSRAAASGGASTMRPSVAAAAAALDPYAVGVAGPSGAGWSGSSSGLIASMSVPRVGPGAAVARSDGIGSGS
jgi:hypothetical protein